MVSFLLQGGRCNNIFHNTIFPPFNTDVREVLQFMLSDEECGQVFTDKSQFAMSVVTHLFTMHAIGTVVNNPVEQVLECHNIILIGSEFSKINNTLRKITPLYEITLTYLYNGNIQDSGLIFQKNDGELLFKDAEGLLAIFEKDNVHLYTRTQPMTELQKLNQLNVKWKEMISPIQTFMGRPFRVSIFNCSVLAQLGPFKGDGSLSWYYGLEMFLLAEFASRLNLSLTFFVPPEPNKWGHFENFSVDGGVLKMIWKGTADIAGCGLWMDKAMIDIGLEISHFIGEECLKHLVPRPNQIATGWRNTFKPFKAEIWIGLLTCYIFAVLLLYCFAKVSHHWFHLHKDFTALGRCAFEMLSIFFGSETSHVMGALRQLLFIFFVLSFLMNTYFSSRLFSQLTIPRYSEKMESIAELVKNNYYWTTTIYPDFSTMFDLKNPLEKEWVERYIHIKHYKDVKKHFKENPRMALIGHQIEEGVFIDDDLPNEFMKKFETSSECLGKKFYGFGYRKGSPFANPMNRIIGRLHSVGLIQKAINDMLSNISLSRPYVYELQEFQKFQLAHHNGLSLKKGIGIFYLLGIGLSISLLTFIFEKLEKPKNINGKT